MRHAKCLAYLGAGAYTVALVLNLGNAPTPDIGPAPDSGPWLQEELSAGPDPIADSGGDPVNVRSGG